MNRNVESRFALSPNLESMSRSRFARPFSHKTTFDAGQLIPFYLEEVLPGDTHQIDTSFLIRMQTLLDPVMDDMYLDTYYFFVPNRLVWEHWKQFMGENTDSAWIPQVSYSVPQIKSPSSTGWTKGTLADYFGIPTGIDLGNTTVSALPFRGYAMIVNEFFRDENLVNYLNIPTGDSTQTGTNGTNYVNDIANGGMPFICAKYHDYFTSCTPAPQKGPDVEINLAGLSGSIPVYGNTKPLGLMTYYDSSIKTASMATSIGNYSELYGDTSVSGSLYNTPSGTSFSKSNGINSYVGVIDKTRLGSDLSKSGLIADLSAVSGESVITINQLRQAFQVQKFYERDATSGSRYTELILSHFGVQSPDARLQRPEYLGGSRTRININSVVQTSETGSTPQGTTAAYSVTTDKHSDFTRSFTEHGFIFGLAVVRYDHTYQQGIERMWRRNNRFDYYWPLFANLGNQAVKNSEIYAQGSSVVNNNTSTPYDDEVFGYQEAWAEYRYKPNRVSGEMRSTYTTPLDSWHLADDYSQLPSLSAEWIQEDKTNVDRCLAVTSSTANQFFGDFYVQDIATRVMPVYSVPGLIDHH